MVRTKVTVRRLPNKMRKLPAWMVNREYGRKLKKKKKKIYSFKIKQTLPAQNTVNIIKNEQILKTINVRRKSKYFSGKNCLIF